MEQVDQAEKTQMRGVISRDKTYTPYDRPKKRELQHDGQDVRNGALTQKRMNAGREDRSPSKSRQRFDVIEHALSPMRSRNMKP